MFKVALASLKEMAAGLFWPLGRLNAALDWTVREVKKWKPKDCVKAVEFGAVLIAITVFVVEFRIDRPRDRGVRIATMFAQIAQVHALPDGAGLNVLKPIVVALASEGVPMEQINLSNADLNNANLYKTKFYRANLSGANLIGANFSLANLNSANLSGAMLIAANLSGANLDVANLSGANLFGAGLSGARLGGADLTGAILHAADLKDVRGLDQQQIENCRSTAPPFNLPDGLTWPFEEKDGEWVRKKK